MPNSTEDLLQLKLEKASNTLFEAGRRAERSRQTFVGFSVFAALIALSGPAKDPVPVLGVISVSWPLACLILTILSSASFYAMRSMTYYQRLLAMQVALYLKKLSSTEEHWFMYYPASFSLRIIKQGSYELPPTSLLVSFVISAAAYIANPYIVYFIGTKSNFSFYWKIAALIVGFLLFASLLLTFYTTNWARWGDKAREIKILDK